MSLAPCVAVVGPANSGKTTLLHQLDDKLQRRLDAFLVLKGNPDGTGRYLYHAPELRNEPAFKQSVKGRWGDTTVDRICEWIEHGRRNLSLALLDFGGRHDEQTAEGNARMLRACSHYLLVSREDDVSGSAIWDAVCRNHGLVRLGWMRSLPACGPQPAPIHAGSEIAATFQVDIRPGDPTNDVALRPLVDALCRLSRPPGHAPYVNLHRSDGWHPGHITDVAGHDARITELVAGSGSVVLGGAAPVWAYLAGLRHALRVNRSARIFLYDPGQPGCLVEIPAEHRFNGDFPEGALSLHWTDEGGLSVLHFEITTPDKFLPPSAAQNLAGAPAAPPAPSAAVALSGKAPIWLFATYARWLIAAGAQRLGTWDGRSGGSIVQVWQ